MSRTTTLPSPTQQAADKRVPILAVVAALGIQICATARNGNYVCLSPFRPESTASFHVSEPKNCWIDFGEVENGKPVGGDALRLLMRLYSVNLPQARVLLRELAQVALSPEQLADATPQVKRSADSPKMSFFDVTFGRLTHPYLIQYLVSRNINWGLIQGNEQTLAHLQQVTYQVVGKATPKPKFSIAWKTEAGHEIRNAGFQNCMGGRGITYIKGREPGCMIFEGFMDYLSALTYYKRSSFRCSVLILNSATTIGAAVPYVEHEPVVHWFGDNDAAGEKTLAFLRDALPPGRIRTYNEIYREYKDFNDFLTRTPPSKPLPRHRAAASKQSLTAKWWLWVVFDEVDEARSKRTGRIEHKRCTFYARTNDEAGYDSLLALRHQLQSEWRYYRFCERTTPGKFRILHCEGLADNRPRAAPSPVPVREVQA